MNMLELHLGRVVLPILLPVAVLNGIKAGSYI